MKHIKPATLGLLKKPYRQGGRNYLVVSALGFFSLGPDQPRFLPDSEQWQKLMHVLPVGQVLDEIMPKVRSEVLLTGSAFAPGGRAVQQLTVGLALGALRKTVRVVGDRRWVNSLLPLYQVSEPVPFTEMPLCHARAFGGARHSGNPLGCGYTGNAWSALFGQNHGVLPNLEYPQHPITSPAHAYAPASFGPIGVDWSPRKHLHGTFDQHWLEHDAPGLAADMDALANNRAPADQWLLTGLLGGERYCLDNVHPHHPRIEGHLPRFAARAFVQRRDASAIEEVALTLDTVWFFPSLDLGLLIYHGQTAISDPEAQDVDAVMVAYEDAGAAKDLQHYQHVFALRSHAETAALHVYNERQLTPSTSPHADAQRQVERDADAAARQARLQARTAEMQQDLCRKYNLPAPAPVTSAAPARATGPSAREIAEGDFDLTETVAGARAGAAHARAHGVRKMAELHTMKAAMAAQYGTQPGAPADLLAQQNAAFELASVPAWDLLPAAQRAAAMGPSVDALVANLKLPPPQDPALILSLREKFSQSLLKTPALRRTGRHAAVTPSAPAQALAPEVATWLGRQIQQWLQGGAALAGRDLAGADLRGMDFSGADLREVMLECADLSGATFIGATLGAATLTGAILDGADFSGADLRRANLCGTRAVATCFAGANLAHTRANGAVWRNCDLRRANLNDSLAHGIDLTGACLDDADLTGASFLQAQASGSSWQRATLEKTILLQANLAHADFSAARLLRVTLLDAVLPHSRWRGARLTRVAASKSDWRHADLSAMLADQCGWHGACFVGADLSDAHCVHSSFDDCDFSQARLCRGLFTGSRFMNAQLCEADATAADFYQAMGRKANFSGANLHGANLVRMDLGGAVFTNAILTQVRLDAHRRLA